MKHLIALIAALFLVGTAFAQLTTTHVGRGGFGGGTYVGPYDVVAVVPTACWSLRACGTATAGSAAVTICNAGDATCLDINTLGNGDFDILGTTNAPLSCTSGSCTIKRWYDQTGFGNVVLQNTIGSRPTLVFNCLGTARPCASYSGTNALEGSTLSSILSEPYTTSVIAKRTAAFTTQQNMFSFTSGGVQFVFTSTANQVGIYSGTGVPTASATDNAFHAFNVKWDSPGASNINVDGTSNSVTGNGSGNIGSTFCVGLGAGANCNFGGLQGQMVEIIVWAGDRSSSFTALCHNQFAYWGTSVSC